MGKISAAIKEEDIKLRFTDILNLVPDGPNQLASRFVVLVQHTINFVKSVADARTFATRIRKVETKEMNINKTYDSLFLSSSIMNDPEIPFALSLESNQRLTELLQRKGIESWVSLLSESEPCLDNADKEDLFNLRVIIPLSPTQEDSKCESVDNGHVQFDTSVSPRKATKHWLTFVLH